MSTDEGRPNTADYGTALADEVRRFLAIPVIERGVTCGSEWADEWLTDGLRNKLRCGDVQRLADALAKFDAPPNQGYPLRRGRGRNG